MADSQGLYIGRSYDPQQGKVTDQSVLYNPADLTTHAVVVGMTGSGKTGLCIGLLEEAALSGIPALMIDPKGDITNLLLHFPNLLPEDFKPWVSADQARREGKTIDQAAAETAVLWGKGLADWGIPQERLRQLSESARFSVYTPGSDSGISVSILASLKAPPIPWENNRELLREKISGTVIAILGLVGLQDIDPVRSREHILLSNIFEHAWSRGKDLDLGELILQTQAPPFEKLGVFDINRFFPEKDRFDLAMLLNNILAAPAFQPWIEGHPLDIPSLLYTPDGRPRHSVFYIAHLSDQERMFFVTLLYSAVESWMRSQSGATTLRALVYFDEIFGYMPPLANPPSKQIMLRMLKQARAFGIGQVLVSQNPVDIDYKGLSNTGTWFIGKLQTDQDKQRLLDGLESAMSGGMDRSEYDRLISTLGKRVFLLHSVHAKRPQLFQTRWVMNYLAGPLTRSQIPALNQLAEARHTPFEAAAPAEADASPVTAAPKTTSTPASVTPAASPADQKGLSITRPVIPTGVREYFLPNNLTFTAAFKAAGRAYPAEAYSQGLVYRPLLLAQAYMRFLDRKYKLDAEQYKTAVVPKPDRRGVVRWDNFVSGLVDASSLDTAPDPQARFAALETSLADAKLLAALQKDFLDWAYRSAQIIVRANEALEVYAGPEVSSAGFRAMCAEAASLARDEEAKKVAYAFDKKFAVIQERLQREERELAQDESDLSQRKMEEWGTHAENVFGLFGGRKSSRRLSSSLSKRRMSEKAKVDVEESQQTIRELKKQIAELEKEKAGALETLHERWSTAAAEIREITVAALKKDVRVDLFGVAWMPYHVVKIGDEIIELPGYAEP